MSGYRSRVAVEASARWTENRASRGLRAVRLGELWAYRELAYFLALRDVKARYKQAAFGVAWAVIQPIAGVALFTFVFQRLASVESDGIPYPVFSLVGFLAWTYFASTLTAAVASLVANSALVTKVYFPRLAAPVSALLPGLINLLPGLPVLAILMLHYGVAPNLALLALPACLAWLVAAALGVGLLLSTLNVRYRDVGSVVPTLLQLWLFASPVAYPTSLVPHAWLWVYSLNPMTGIIDALRWSLVAGPAPGPEVLVSLAGTAVLLVAGLFYFAASERRFADVI
jgi:lipopolysaccharide transport system permease protein